MVAAMFVGTAGPGAAAGADAIDESGFDYAAMAEDIEVMGRILTKSLRARYEKISGTAHPFVSNTLGDTGDSSGKHVELALDSYRYAVAGLDSTPDLNMRGFYVPGSGLLFALDISARTTMVEESPEKEPQADLWEETEQEVRSGKARVLPVSEEPQQKRIIDPGAVDMTVDKLLTALAQHGSKVDQLDSDDSITLAIRFRPSQSIVWGSSATLFALGSAATSHAAPQRVIIQVPLATIRDHAGGRKDLETFKQRARITKY
jgi:hypothetical protein